MRKTCTRPWASGDQTLAFQETDRQNLGEATLKKRKKQLKRAGRCLKTGSARMLFPDTQENEKYQETGLEVRTDFQWKKGACRKDGLQKKDHRKDREPRAVLGKPIRTSVQTDMERGKQEELLPLQ